MTDRRVRWRDQSSRPLEVVCVLVVFLIAGYAIGKYAFGW